MWRGVVGGAATAAVALLWSCTDLGGLLAGGTPDVPDGDTVGEPDTGSNGDAGEPGDAADAGNPGDGAPYCAALDGSVAFCDDFDGPPRTDFGLIANDGGNARPDDASATSSPNSLLMSMTASAAACRYAYRAYPLALAYKAAVRHDFDIRLGHLDDASDGGGFPADLASGGIRISAADLSGECAYAFKIGTPGHKTQLVVTSIVPPVNTYFDLSRPIPPGQWTHVSLLVEGAPTDTPTLTVLIDGVVVLDKLPSPVATCKYGRVSRVAPGIYCIGNVGGDVESRVDNMAVWTQ